jgi:alcohol dehydrogenase
MQRVRAAVLEAPRQIVINSYDSPSIGPDEMLLKTEIAGVCGSDVKIYRGTIGKVMEMRVPMPVVMGDEILGYVADAGERFSKTHGVKKGSRVIVEPRIPCNHCERCITGNHTFCKNIKAYGWIRCDESPHLWGSYAEYVYVPLNARIHRVPEDMPAEVAILAAVVVADGIQWIQNIGGLGIGDDVVIIGPGPQGLASTLVARNRGAGLIAVAGMTKDKVRMNFARELGADYVIDVEKEDLQERVRELTGGSMADIVVECSGNAKAIQSSLDLVKPLGTVVHMSMTGMEAIPLVTQKIAARQIAFKGGLGPAGNVEAAIKLVHGIVDRKEQPLERFISHKFPLERSEEALRAMACEIEGIDPIKVAVDLRQSQ